MVIGPALLGDAGRWASNCLDGKIGKALIVSNRRVFNLYGKDLETALRSAGFATSVHLIGDGERFKNLKTLDAILRTLGRNRFSRTDAIVALGGGVVGDVAGFAAAIYLRGIAFLQIPTTLLSMIDSSVGGKTGVNTEFGKNLVGAFYQPRGVLVDIETLRTLPRREITAGLCEAIKQGAVGSTKLFKQTSDLLQRPVTRFSADLSDASFAAELTGLLREQIAFKASIVKGDETESASNTSPRSRKILNFGHTFAHALEKVTGYKYLKHGEAVGYGIMFAARLSKKLELIDQDGVDLLNDVVRRAGTLPEISYINPSKVIEAFKYDKKQIGDSLHWILLRKIGKPVIVPGTEIPLRLLATTTKNFIGK